MIRTPRELVHKPIFCFSSAFLLFLLDDQIIEMFCTPIIMTHELLYRSTYDDYIALVIPEYSLQWNTVLPLFIYGCFSAEFSGILFFRFSFMVVFQLSLVVFQSRCFQSKVSFIVLSIRYTVLARRNCGRQYSTLR